MSTGIEMSLDALARLAWRDRLNPSVYQLARKVTDPEASRQDKMRAIVDELHRRSAFASNLDADDAALFVAAAAMSVGVRCRFVGVRYGSSWTCWVAYEVGDHWETIDPLRQRPDREPDEQVMGPMPDKMEGA